MFAVVLASPLLVVVPKTVSDVPVIYMSNSPQKNKEYQKLAIKTKRCRSTRRSICRRSEIFIPRSGSTPLLGIQNSSIPIIHNHTSLDIISLRGNCEEIKVEEHRGVYGGARFDGDGVGIPGHSRRSIEQYMRSDGYVIIDANSASVVECGGKRAAIDVKAHIGRSDR